MGKTKTLVSALPENANARFWLMNIKNPKTKAGGP
jgi:hypothetical protein